METKKILTVGPAGLLASVASLPQHVAAQSIINALLADDQKIIRPGIIPETTIELRGRRQLKRMKASFSNGWKFAMPKHLGFVPPNPHHTCDSTRAERRRAELGRS